jgi:hypothetical protein
MTRRGWRLLTTAALCAVLALGPIGDAGAARRATEIPGLFNTSIVVANPGDDEAIVTLNFRTSDGLSALTSPPSFTVRPGSSVLTYVPNIPGLADGRYGVIVESNRYVSVVTNLRADGPTSATAYNGIPDTNGDYFNTLYAPFTVSASGGYTSSIVVQNGQGTAANVTIDYKDVDGNVVTRESRPLAPYASSLFDQGGTVNLGEGIRSAAITADRFVSAIVLVSDPGAGRLGSYRAMRGGDSSVYMPAVYNQYAGYVTALAFQNADRDPTTVSASFHEAASGRNLGSTATNPIASQAAQTILTYDLPGFTPAVPGGFNGSAVARSIEGRIVVGAGVIRQTAVGNANFEMYNSVGTSTATTRLTCATILKNYFNYNTSVTVQNVGTAPAVLTVAYVDSAGRTVFAHTPPAVQPGAAWFSYTPNVVELPVGFSGSLVVTSGGQKVVGLVNELFGAGDLPGDHLFSYGCDSTLPGAVSAYRTFAPVVLKNAAIRL